MMKKVCVSSTVVLLLVILGISCGRGRSEKVYDVYSKGIHLAELTIKDGPRTPTYTIKKKDFKSNQWLSPLTASEDEVGRNEDFQLWGAISDLPSKIREITQINWALHEAVAWPDENSIYVKHRELAESVGRREITAWYWALEDASSPMDLVIGPTNELIAGIDPSNDLSMVLRGYEDFTTLEEWSNPKISPARYGYHEFGKFMVEMSDGVKLATLVFLPDDAANGPYPVVFIRTPYGITGGIDRYWHYCARGYAVVLQACRGTAYWDPDNQSEGEWEMLINEPRDGADALAWIADQPWCNGSIGMQGGSYVGFTQWACTMAENPALKCIIPESSMGTVFSDMQYMGGGFVEGVTYYGFWMMNKEILPERSWPEIFHHRPLIELDTFGTGQDLAQWNKWLDHWTNDDYWKQQDFYRSGIQREFASLQISGWFDDDFPGTRRNWELVQRTSSQPQRLILGPWKHGYNRDRRLNGFSFGHDALRDDIWILKQKWYDRFLKGIDNGVEDTAVEYFVLGDNEWRTANKWPPEDAKPQMWYFHSNGKVGKHATYGKLTPVSPEGVEPADVYQYDPGNPAPNWYSFEQMQRWEDVQSFPYDFKDIESRDDVVVYTSEPLEEDLTVAGDLMAVLYASCDVLDTDWWVYLSDVHPDGSSVRLTIGMLRARFRNLEDKQHHVFGSNFEKEELLSGNKDDVVRYEINIPSIAATFKEGHRLRIAVTNACDNYSFPNSNTGGSEAYVTRTVVGTMAIHHTREHPSHVILPVLEN